MRKYSFLFALFGMLLLNTGCSDNNETEAEATLSLSATYADMTGESGASATITATTNCENITAVKEDQTADWLDISVDGHTITVTANSLNHLDEERWCNVIVTATRASSSNVAVAKFTARQATNSNLVKIAPEKTNLILSAAAYGEKAGFDNTDNRYKVRVTLTNATDFTISWDRTASWLTNVEKCIETIDNVEYLTGIYVSTTQNVGTESRNATITLSVAGADYATKEITVYQKASPFKFAIGDYDKVNQGTVVYLDTENYNFYLVLDNVQSLASFYGAASIDGYTLPAGASDQSSTANNVATYCQKIGADKFTAANFPALFYAFNRNAPAGTTYTKYSDVPVDVISDVSKWHLPSRDELAYIFKRTIYENYVKDANGHQFNAVLEKNAADNSVTIDNIATTGTIYYSSTEYQSGSNAGKIAGYATTNLRTNKTNNYNPYAGYEIKKSYARCVKKIIVDTNE